MFAGMEWRLRVDNPTFGAWLIAASYIVAAVLCIIAGRARRARAALRPEGGRDRSPLFWYIVAAALFVLGVNKQLALQILLVEIGREISHSGGWYATRRAVQVAFLIALGECGLGAIIFFAWLIRRAFLRHVFALAGLMALVAFLVIRAITIQGIDRLYGRDFGNRHVLFIVEFGAILVIIASAMVNIASRHGGASRE